MNYLPKMEDFKDYRNEASSFRSFSKAMGGVKSSGEVSVNLTTALMD